MVSSNFILSGLFLSLSLFCSFFHCLFTRCGCSGSLKGFHAQADLLVLTVKVNNFRCNDLTDRKNIRRFRNMLSGNLRNMKQRVDSGSKLYECAEICHTGNFTLYNIACSKLLSRCKPRILLREFQRKGNFLTVDLFDKDFQFLSNCKYFLRISTLPQDISEI